MADWAPLNDNHAISVMAAYVFLQEDMPDLAMRRIIDGTRQLAEELGLSQTKSSQSVQLHLSAKGLQHNQKSESVGLTFYKAPTLEDDDPEIFKETECIQLEKNAFIYRAWDYVSWDWHYDRLQKLMAPAIEAALQSALFSRVGLEYVDRFSLDGPLQGNLASLIKSDSRYVCPHIFEDEDLFHVHTGRFIDIAEHEKTRDGVKINASRVEDTNWVEIVTTRDKVFESALNENPDPNPVWEKQHGELKTMLSEIITSDQAERIYLND